MGDNARLVAKEAGAAGERIGIDCVQESRWFNV